MSNPSIEILSNIKLITSGGKPTIDSLPVGCLAFGKIVDDGLYHLFGNADGVIQEYSSGDLGIGADAFNIPIEKFYTEYSELEPDVLKTITLPTAIFGTTTAPKVFVDGVLVASDGDYGFSAGGMTVTFMPRVTKLTVAEIKVFYPGNPHELPLNKQYIDVEFEIDEPDTEITSAIDVRMLKEGTTVFVDWGDGATQIDACDSTCRISFSHTYSEPGTYVVKIREDFGQMISCMFNSQSTKVVKTIMRYEGDAIVNLNNVFQNQTKYLSFKSGFRFNTPNVVSANNCFSGSGIQLIPHDVLWDCVNIETLSAFLGSSSIREIPGDLLNGLDKITSATGFAKACPQLEYVGPGLFRNKQYLTNIGQSFYGCPELVVIGEGLAEGCISLSDVNGLFNGCKKLEDIPGNTIANTDIKTLLNFAPGCTSLKIIHPELFRSCTKCTTISGLFKGNSSIHHIPGDLLQGMENVSIASSAFQLLTNCIDLGDGLLNPIASSLENATNMFASCTKSVSNINNLVSIEMPRLLTTTNMFSGNRLMTGEGNTIVSLMTAPPTASAKTLGNCTGLSDWESVPAIWK